MLYENIIILIYVADLHNGAPQRRSLRN